MARSGYSFVPPFFTGGSAAPKDRVITQSDKVFIRTADGWDEQPTAATSVMIALEVELGGSPYDPEDGNSIFARSRRGQPMTEQEIMADTERVLAALEEDGLISNVVVEATDKDGNLLSDVLGRAAVRTRWRDLVAGAEGETVVYSS